MTMGYKIDGGADQSLSLNWFEYADNNNKFQSGGSTWAAQDIDISGLTPGSHTIAVWFTRDDKWDSNSSANYVANFTIAAPTYAFTVKEGTADADKWTAAPNPAEAGQSVTLTYTGKKMVKSVKVRKKAAAPAAATVTTAPTATTGDIVVGSTTALVSAGTAEGGTMMYKVTTENTQPASTEGFSATVPTAEGRAAGTYYVWYYVQADASHTDSEISATAIEVTVKAPTLADVFTDGAVVCVTVSTNNNFSNSATGTYSAGSGTYTTTGSDGTSGVSMTKDGNNLVVTMTRYNTYTVTLNTTNNIYVESATASDNVWRMTTLQSITINGVDITSKLTNATPTETIVTWTESDMSSAFYATFDGWTNNNSHQGITVTASGSAMSSWNDNNINVMGGEWHDYIHFFGRKNQVDSDNGTKHE